MERHTRNVPPSAEFQNDLSDVSLPQDVELLPRARTLLFHDPNQFCGSQANSLIGPEAISGSLRYFAFQHVCLESGYVAIHYLPDFVQDASSLSVGLGCGLAYDARA
jgi:hypothetical protein